LEETVLAELRQLVRDQPETELSELVSQLEQLLPTLQAPEVDQGDALATLSEMQAAISAARAQFDLAAIKAQLRALGEALATAKAPEDVARALMEGELDKASELLEQLDVSELTRLEARTVAEKLAKLTREMEEARLDRLREGTRKLSEGLEQDDAEQAAEGSQQLAEVCRQQSLRHAIDQRLAYQLTLLAESKQNTRSGKNGSPARGRSDQPSDTWGKGTGGPPLGEEPTTLDSQRQRVEITGTLGEGPSQRQTSRVDKARQTAQRGYREQFPEFERMNEAVLQSEPLPIGHRQTIRRYFQSIRPADSEPAQNSRRSH
jgi:hypothetical protein